VTCHATVRYEAARNGFPVSTAHCVLMETTFGEVSKGLRSEAGWAVYERRSTGSVRK
jgi:hypothetical protein